MNKFLLLLFTLLYCNLTFSQANLLPLMEKNGSIGLNLSNRIGPLASVEVAYTLNNRMQIGLAGGRSIIIKGDEYNTDFIRFTGYAAGSLLSLSSSLHLITNLRIELDSKDNDLYQGTMGLSYLYSSVKSTRRNIRNMGTKYIYRHEAQVGFSIEGGYLVHPYKDGWTIEAGMDARYNHFTMGVRVGDSTRFRFIYLIN